MNVRFVLSRAGHYWPVLLTLVLGVVLAVALLASGPILVDTALDLSLRRTLLDASSGTLSDPLAAHLRLDASMEPGTSESALDTFYDLDARVAALVQTHLRPRSLADLEHPYVARIVPAGETRWAFPWVDGELDTGRRVNVRFYDRWAEDGRPALLDQVEFVAGGWPAAQPPAGEIVPVVIGEAMARSYDLAVGDPLPVSLREQSVQPDLAFEIAGIVRPAQADLASEWMSAYWFGASSPLLSQKSARYDTQFGVLVDQACFFELAERVYAPSHVRVVWNVLLHPSAMRVKDVPEIRARLAELEADLAAWDEPVGLETGLDGTLAEFTRRSAGVRFPLYLMTAAIALLALYYVTMAASLWLRQVQREVSVLRSRGASAGQILGIQLGEASLLGSIAVLGGPLLALVTVRALAVWGPMANVSQGAAQLALPRSAWLWAALGGGVCVVALLAHVPESVRAASQGGEAGIVGHQLSLSRSARAPWWQRFYLDVVVFVVGLVLIWRARLQSPSSFDLESASVDWLLVLAPLALLMGAAVILRVFPVLLRWMASLASRGRGLPAPLALWQIARDPTLVARLVLLLTLAMALGVLSRGLNQALDQNEVDQSQYAVGSDVRVVGAAASLQAGRDGTDAGGAVARVWRETGTLSVPSVGAYPEFELLAVEPRTFAQVAQFRDDFSARPLPELLETLEVSEGERSQTVLELPGQPDRLGVWLWMPEEEGGPAAAARSSSRPRVNRVTMEAKLQDAAGDLYVVRLRLVENSILEQRPVQEGWHAFEGALRSSGSPEDGLPVSLHSLWLRNVDLPLVLEDLMVREAAGGEVRVVEAKLDGWQVCGERSGGLVGLQRGECPAVEPLPALISPALQESAQLRVGDHFGTWVRSEPCEFVATGVVRYWPTLYERDAGFLVTARDPLLLHLNSADKTPVLSNELLIALPEGDDAPDSDVRSERIGSFLKQGGVQVMDALAVRRRIQADAMALGLRSATLLSFFVTATLSLVGFGTHFYLSTRQRQSSFVVLRALGVSPGQLYGSLLLEQALLVFSGLALGTLLGLLLLRLIVPGLPLHLGGAPPVPPFVAHIGWVTVARIYAVLLASFVVAMGAATGMLWRARLHRALRMEQE